MKTIIIASHNPVKVQAALGGFQKMFPHETWTIQEVDSDSGVSRQPMSDAETRLGAHNRATVAQTARPAADFWIGIEGGVEANGGDLDAFAWIVIRSPEMEGQARTAAFFLPPGIASLVRQGLELGEADDQVFGRTNSKQENGAIGILTGDVVDRTGLYEMAVILALAPFTNPGLYKEAHV